LIAYRHMIRYLVIRDLKVRYRRSVLGFAWSFLNPLLMMAVFTLVFTALRQRSIVKYPIFLLSGLLPWQWFSNSLIAASSSMASNAALVRKVYFPREVLPLVAILSNMVNYLLALIPYAAFMLFFRVPVTPWIASLPLVMGVQFLFTFGLSLILCTADVFYRDTKEILQVIIRLWFFLTPIFYSPDTLTGTIARWSSILNPVAPLVTGYRAILYAGDPLDYRSLAPGLALGVLLIIVGYRVFCQYSGVFAEEV
jgi:ABC-type polysaccharide/polyol phosphate export permease